MRRCPQCQAPSPDAELSCRACGAALPAFSGRPKLLWSGIFGPRGRRLLWAALPALLFRISDGNLLRVGVPRQEWHFLLFHLVQGLLLGLSLAWLWSESRVKAAAWWVAGGLAGGLLAEGLEIWFSYHHWMGYLTLRVWVGFGFQMRPSLPYEVLQILRLAGPLLCLGWVRVRRGGDFGSWVRLGLGAAAALGLGAAVRGAWVAWYTFAVGLGWEHALLCGLSLMAFFWALGPSKGLTSTAEIH